MSLSIIQALLAAFYQMAYCSALSNKLLTNIHNLITLSTQMQEERRQYDAV